MPLRQLEKQGVRFDRVPCAADGSMSLKDLEERILPSTKAVVMLHASNVCGTVLPVAQIGAVCRARGIRFILDAAQTEGVPVLGIVDEVLRGTNTIERISASSQILRRLSDTNAIVFAATHDIELSYILEKFYKNYHFTEQITDGDVRFDYVLREGRATSRNAIALLEVSGYGEDISQAAREQAERFERTGEWRL